MLKPVRFVLVLITLIVVTLTFAVRLLDQGFEKSSQAPIHEGVKTVILLKTKYSYNMVERPF